MYESAAEASGSTTPAPGPSTQSATTATTATDSALSLRAVALSTLKSKRRKPASAQLPALPSRPVMSDSSAQLDYGPGDSEAPNSHPQRSLSPSNGQAREEGEISDSEEAPAPTTIVDPTQSSPKATSATSGIPNLTSAATLVESQTNHSTIPASPISTFPQPTMESPPHNSLADMISEPETPLLNPLGHYRRGSSEMNIDKPHPFVDENHVRPGLQMTQAQYDTAKDICLDLLGWGVPPSYLLDCGLSREIIFYVFNELNLRLPEGIDPNEFVPYNPSTVAMFLHSSQTRSYGSLAGHRDASKSSTTLDSSNLHDMEKQRRQELLARKAVYASRKGKAPSTDGADVEMTSLVATETVDDFLKSIPADDEPSSTPRGPDDQMYVDPPERYEPDSYPESFTPTEPPTSTESHVSTFRGRSSSSGDSNGTQRRNGKRPVAADFVDFDAAPRSREGHGPRAKRGGSFASVSATRRCVIDLSDDEGGDDDSVNLNSRASGYNTPTIPFSSEDGPYRTPPIAFGTEPTSRVLSPAALAEKEKEILKMRQMIAERERIRVVKSLKFKKLGPTANGNGNGTDSDKGISTEVPTPVKQEEEEASLPSARLPSTEIADKMDVDSSATSNPPITQEAMMDTTEQPTAVSNDDSSSVASTPPAIDHPNPMDTQVPESREALDRSTNEQDVQPQATDAVDVDPDVSSSAQATMMASQALPKPDENQDPPQSKLEDAATYRSLLDGYPLLRSHPIVQEVGPLSDSSSDSTSPIPNANLSTLSPTSSYLHSSPSVHSHIPLAVPDLKPLRVATLMKALDPTKRICQFEIPGGGVCRDINCEDNHLNRMSSTSPSNLFSQRYQPSVIEPGDQDTAEYLNSFLPESVRAIHGSELIPKMTAALEDIRVKNPSMALEERAASVIVSLQSTS